MSTRNRPHAARSRRRRSRRDRNRPDRVRQLAGRGHTGGGVVRVAAGENFWGNIAAQIGSRHVLVTSTLTSPTADPHLYEPDVANAVAVAEAGLVVENARAGPLPGREPDDGLKSPRTTATAIPAASTATMACVSQLPVRQKNGRPCAATPGRPAAPWAVARGPKAPDATLLGQRAGLHRAGYQLPQVPPGRRTAAAGRGRPERGGLRPCRAAGWAPASRTAGAVTREVWLRAASQPRPVTSL